MKSLVLIAAQTRSGPSDDGLSHSDCHVTMAAEDHRGWNSLLLSILGCSLVRLQTDDWMEDKSDPRQEHVLCRLWQRPVVAGVRERCFDRPSPRALGRLCCG
eukprot:757009-Hanusia_phi.AAC.2